MLFYELFYDCFMTVFVFMMFMDFHQIRKSTKFIKYSYVSYGFHIYCLYENHKSFINCSYMLCFCFLNVVLTILYKLKKIIMKML